VTRRTGYDRRPGTGLVNGRQYRYKVTAYDDSGCESEIKTMFCAVPIAAE
jgi:hypothetical protein